MIEEGPASETVSGKGIENYLNECLGDRMLAALCLIKYHSKTKDHANTWCLPPVHGFTAYRTVFLILPHLSPLAPYLTQPRKHALAQAKQLLEMASLELPHCTNRPVPQILKDLCGTVTSGEIPSGCWDLAPGSPNLATSLGRAAGAGCHGSS